MNSAKLVSGSRLGAVSNAAAIISKTLVVLAVVIATFDRCLRSYFHSFTSGADLLLLHDNSSVA